MEVTKWLKPSISVSRIGDSDTAEGIGMYSIATRLNKAKVATFGGPNGWHQSYIAKILSSRAVLGEFQPHIRVDGKRVNRPRGAVLSGAIGQGAEAG